MIVNAQTTDVLNSSWHLSLDLIVVGTFILIIGLSTFASVSDHVNGFGFVGSNLLLLGGLLLIIGTAALDWILLPFLISLANTMASTINDPATETQNKLNTIISSLNSLDSPLLQQLFPCSIPHISEVSYRKNCEESKVCVEQPSLFSLSKWPNQEEEKFLLWLHKMKT